MSWRPTCTSWSSRPAASALCSATTACCCGWVRVLLLLEAWSAERWSACLLLLVLLPVVLASDGVPQRVRLLRTALLCGARVVVQALSGAAGTECRCDWYPSLGPLLPPLPAAHRPGVSSSAADTLRLKAKNTPSFTSSSTAQQESSRNNPSPGSSTFALFHCLTDFAFAEPRLKENAWRAGAVTAAKRKGSHDSSVRKHATVF